jgi:hypothetical protein
MELGSCRWADWKQCAENKRYTEQAPADEMNLLESSLRRIASGMENAGIGYNTARQIVAQSQKDFFEAASKVSSFRPSILIVFGFTKKILVSAL